MAKSPADAEILETLSEIMTEALLVDRERIIPEARIISDLEAESIDIVDIRFRLEHAYDIRIDQRAMMRSLGKDLTAEELDRKFTVGWVVEYLKRLLDGSAEARIDGPG
jgi:acyl carrier protein